MPTITERCDGVDRHPLTCGNGGPPAGWDPDASTVRVRARSARLADLIAEVAAEQPSLSRSEAGAEADRRLRAEAGR